MNELTAATKAIFSVAVALCVALVVVVVFFLGVRMVEADERAREATDRLHELTGQNRGPQGPDGVPGRAPTQQEIADAVEAYCDAHDGCKGPQGAPGKNGANGTPGANGAPGAGVTRVTCHGTYIRFWAGATSVGDVKMVCIP